MNKQDFNKILKDHKLWLDSDGEKGTRANLSRANLSEAYLSEANLSGANLSEAYLSGAKFDVNFRDVSWFESAVITKDQLCWLVLNPKFGEFHSSLTISA
tara:strand:+ start:82 stop:381 length:300 start_codon:yes stop_codon:yes gene_type:complete